MLAELDSWLCFDLGPQIWRTWSTSLAPKAPMHTTRPEKSLRPFAGSDPLWAPLLPLLQVHPDREAVDF